jgi:small subunit ribosomal protein S9
MEPKKKPTTKKTADKQEDKREYIYAKGGRKTSTAQTRLYLNAKGVFTVNDRPYNEYFPTEDLQRIFLNPLKIASREKTVDLSMKVHGGGIHSQAEACRHSISRALIKVDPELRGALKAEGFLMRDPRVKERKKPGLRRARRSPQWSKR